ncbi:hypothetical protein SS1G_12108 [Sclerotinia sclerotiorum 1980 UF-70]|uniref:Major facilitator superfamily (MFS) profile domain-containing protein n=2 Tax=Sclerotinia sclerotiorum (strain ATCC 18683 / 1980 / Ss-1) TaxID=665079 RepID=A0A1D9Q2Y1_SCLS1|nr:hypothetical protein SS1G_12108 [Sclerotinia sclerotiorum 1980 UF-70]APA09320.1 hypothetical protein sscle_05g040900 [Sclerotinia sclerotiorum 1980 UF-70]EDN95903.1 hypothetical protein SS1G_12108 [Sclerotinia sclerotiorum 1980 UF-70]
MVAVCLAVFLGALNVIFVTTAIPKIGGHFKSSASYTWIGSAFLQANVASIPYGAGSQTSSAHAQVSSVVIGQLVYQNEKAKKYRSLVASIHVALADSLKSMWLVYTCITAAGLFASFLIRRKILTHAHVETKTGLEAERERLKLDFASVK